MGSLDVKTQAAPATPSSGYIRVYAKSDGLLYWKDDAGTEYTINTGSVSPWQGLVPSNLGFTATVAGNALTIALKGIDGNDPSATNIVSVPFRSSTAASGDDDVLTVTAATSVVVSSGSTLGARNSVPFRIWIVAFNDAGTFRLGVINCTTTAAGAGSGSDVTAIYPLSGWGIASSTAEGGAGAADSAQTFYTGTAVSSKPYTVLGYVTYESGLGTVGTYGTTPTRAQAHIAGMPLPGEAIQRQRNDTGASATGTTTIPNDDTIPQNTEGDQYMTQAITPSSAANVLQISVSGNFANTAAANNYLQMSLHQDAVANALATRTLVYGGSNTIVPLNIYMAQLAAGTSSTTYKMRGGSNAGGTTTFNGASGGRFYGGVYNSFIEVVEVMG